MTDTEFRQTRRDQLLQEAIQKFGKPKTWDASTQNKIFDQIETQIEQELKDHPIFGTEKSQSLKEGIKTQLNEPKPKVIQAGLRSRLEPTASSKIIPSSQSIEDMGLKFTKDPKIPGALRLTLAPSYDIPMDERAKIIDYGALLKEEANKKALEKLGKVIKGGAVGLGALATASDISEENEVGAALDVAETGLGLAGGVAGKVAPFLELLRPTSTQTQEQEEAELAKYKRLNNMLTEQKKKNRVPASEE